MGHAPWVKEYMQIFPSPTASRDPQTIATKMEMAKSDFVHGTRKPLNPCTHKLLSITLHLRITLRGVRIVGRNWRRGGGLVAGGVLGVLYAQRPRTPFKYLNLHRQGQHIPALLFM